MRKILAATMMFTMILSIAGLAHAKKPAAAHKTAYKAGKASVKKAKADLKPVKQAESPVVVTPVLSDEAAVKTE